MGILNDSGLILQSQPALFDLGVEAWAAEGRSWEWEITGLTDASGDPVDWSDASLTITCEVVDAAGDTVLALDTEGDVSSIRIFKDDGATTGLIESATAPERLLRWACKVADVTDSIDLWGPNESPFHVQRSI